MLQRVFFFGYAVLFLWTLVLSVLFLQFGLVRVVGQVGRHALDPLLRVITGSDRTRLSKPRAKVSKLQFVAISLARESQRRQSIQMELEGLNYSMYDAVDGETDSFDLNEVVFFFGWTRVMQASLDIEDCRVKKQGCRSGSSYHRAKIALDLTYLRLFKKLANSDPQTTFVILEDDALVQVPKGNFSREVTRVVESLPDDWDLLLLYSAKGFVMGPPVSPFANILRSGVGTVGFAFTPKLAQTIVKFAMTYKMHELYIDLVVCGFLTETGRINSYIANPFLLAHGRFESLIV